MPIQGASVPNNLGKVLICIDRAADGDFSGRLYSPFAEHPAEFSGVLELMRHMERLFDRLRFPQPMFSRRSFWEPARQDPTSIRPVRHDVRRYHSDEIYDTERGILATFAVRTSYRRNASWQGAMRWAERGDVRPFGSALELIRLMAAAALPGQRPRWTTHKRRNQRDLHG